MIIARVVILVIVSLWTVHSCKLSSGQGNPVPWLIRIWTRQDVTRVALAQGALVTSNKAVSPCAVLKNVPDPKFSVTGYHFKSEGSYDCHITQTVFKLEHHPRCADGNLESDFSIWTFPYHFRVEGRPYLFSFNPTNQDFRKAASRAVSKKTRCELPIFTDEKLETQHEIRKSVHFLSLEEYLTISCNDSGCIPLNSTTQNVYVINVTRMANGQESDEEKNDFPMGAVLICGGFPMGLTGTVMPSHPMTVGVYSYVSSFRNIIGSINPPPNPTAHARKRVIIVVRRGTVRDRRATTKSAASLRRRNRKTLKHRKRSTPILIPDVDEYVRRGSSRPVRVRSGRGTIIALMMSLFVNWTRLLNT